MGESRWTMNPDPPAGTLLVMSSPPWPPPQQSAPPPNWPPAPIPVLNYDGPRESDKPTRRGAILFLILMIPAAITPFVSFVWSTSPLDVLQVIFNEIGRGGFPPREWQLMLLAAPFFAALPLIAWKGRLVFARATSSGLRTAMWIIAACFACVPPALIIYVVYLAIAEDDVDKSMWYFGAGLAVFVLYACLAAFLAWRRRREHAITMAFYAGYLANAIICLGLFKNDWTLQAGYHLTGLTVVVMVVDTIGAMVAARSREMQ